MRRHLLIRGRVQGVGYRYFVRSKAVNRGVTGWVRNCGNGDVECEAQGEQKVLLDFIGDLKAGPPMARVDSVSETPAAERPEEASFEIKY